MGTGSRSLARTLLHPSFVVCVVVLVAAGVFAGPVARHMRVVLRKDPVPLRKPLTELDKTALGEYEFDRPNIIDPTVLAPLGTQEYIDWQFIDTTVKGRRHPLRHVRCFVTYYTGKPNLVPHTPAVCYYGQGYRTVTAEDLDMFIRSPDSTPLEVPMRAITFVKSDVFERATPTVVYTFHCNGRFVNRRTDVRARLANPFDKGAYFCKVEVTFGTPKSYPLTAAREEAVAAAEKFLNRLLPVLLRDHLPNWEALQGGEPAA